MHSKKIKALYQRQIACLIKLHWIT